MIVSNVAFPASRFFADVARDTMGLAYAPAILTVISNTGKPLSQNPSSVGFYGYISERRVEDYGE